MFEELSEGERLRGDCGLEEAFWRALLGSYMVELKCFCRSCRKFLEVRKCHNQNCLSFYFSPLVDLHLQRGLYVVTDCVFQDPCTGERCLLANFVYPAVLCGYVLFCIPIHKTKLIHFPMGFSGLLIVVISEHFTNSNLILQPPLGREDSNLVQYGLKRIFY